MKHNEFRSSDRLMECKLDSDLGELYLKDNEYTAKAQAEGKPYYRWDTKKMMQLIFDNGCEDTCRRTDYWRFIAEWLCLTLKFVDDEKIQYYMNEFYEGKCYYMDEYYDKTIYTHMYEGWMPYVYTLYEQYLEHNNMEMPKFISKLVLFYIGYFGDITTKLPSDDGMHLVEVSEEEAQKYNGVWISPEEHEKIQKRLDERREEFLRKRGIKND